MLPEVHALDFGGPLQAFFEVNRWGAGYDLVFAASTPMIKTAPGLWLAGLVPYPRVEVGDMVLVPGMDSSTLDTLDRSASAWLVEAYAAGAVVGSVCTGAFVLADAGLLDGRACTTHWKLTDRLQEAYPAAQVERGRLFVQDGRIITSAGVASGIDMSLALIEAAHGPLMAARVAREMVVYFRRNGDHQQESIFLSYRTHLNVGVHRVQDWLIAHLHLNPNLDDLAAVARMSPRHLTRVFRQATGITLKTFAMRLSLERAAQLLLDPAETVESVAHQCGYQDARQLRRIFKKHFGSTPSAWQRQKGVRRAS